MNENCKLILMDEDGSYLEANLEYGEHEKPASEMDTFNINNTYDNAALLELLIERMTERYGDVETKVIAGETYTKRPGHPPLPRPLPGKARYSTLTREEPDE